MIINKKMKIISKTYSKLCFQEPDNMVCCKPYGSVLIEKNSEVRGFFMAGPARAPLFVSFAMVSVAMLELAFEDAGCTKDGFQISFNSSESRPQTIMEATNSGDSCTRSTTLGIKPDSLLPSISVLASILNIFVVPLSGALTDYTQYRRAALVGSLLVCWLTNVFQIFLHSSTWKVLAFSQAVFGSTSYMINIMTVNSYSTEIVEKLDDLAFLQSAGRLWETIPMLFYLIGVTVVALRTNMTVLEKSSFAQISATIITLPFILSLSKLFGTRPALHNIEGKSYLSVGFIQVRSTFHKIRTKHPEAAKFLIAMAFFESATVSIVQLSITYLKSQLKIQDPNKFIVFCVVMMLPAVVATPRFVKKCGGTKKALQIILILLFSTTIFLTLFVHKPEHSAMLVLVGGLFGLGIGSIQSIQRSFYLCVVPSGNEAEVSERATDGYTHYY